MSQITARYALSEAVRYWEPRRILYNCVLLIVVIAVFCANLPKARFDLTFDALQGLFVLAVWLTLLTARHIWSTSSRS